MWAVCARRPRARVPVFLQRCERRAPAPAGSDARQRTRFAVRKSRRGVARAGQHSVQQPCSPAASSRRQSRRVALLRTEVYTENGSREAILPLQLSYCCWASGPPNTRLLTASLAVGPQDGTPRNFVTANAHVSKSSLRSAHGIRESRRAMTRRSHCDIVWHPAWRATANRNAIALVALRY